MVQYKSIKRICYLHKKGENMIKYIKTEVLFLVLLFLINTTINELLMVLGVINNALVNN